jgi:hypothetical protein
MDTDVSYRKEPGLYSTGSGWFTRQASASRLQSAQQAAKDAAHSACSLLRAASSLAHTGTVGWSGPQGNIRPFSQVKDPAVWTAKDWEGEIPTTRCTLPGRRVEHQHSNPPSCS